MNLTAEQREALCRALKFMEVWLADDASNKMAQDISTLKDLLSGDGIRSSEYKWEATEERIHSLRYILGEIAESDKYLASTMAFNLLHIMLEEVQP